MKNIAVLTGDIVKSRTIKDEDIEKVINSLKTTFDEINIKILSDKATFQIYRGDSFQAIIPNPELALLSAIIIRAKMRSLEPISKNISSTSISKHINYAFTDTRIAIGIGEVKYYGNKISESQGEAFQKSGLLLDKLKKENERLAIETPWIEYNKEFFVESKLADAVINRWTPSTSHAVYLHLLEKKNQIELSKFFKISQPAIHKRLVTYGNIGCISSFISRYNELMLNVK